MNNKGKKTGIFSILLTILVIAIYLIPNFAQAVSVEVSLDKTEFVPTDTTIEGDVSINIRDGERVPIQYLFLSLDDEIVCAFNVDGSLATSCPGIISITKTSPGEDYTEGSRTGEDERTNESLDFGPGFGYGYGPAYNGLLSYSIVGNKTGIDEGLHNLKVSVNAADTTVHNFTSEEVSFTISSTAPDLVITESYVCPGSANCFNTNPPKAGENLVVTFVVKNEGNQTTSQNIEYKIDNSPEANIEVNTGTKLAPGKIMRVHAKYDYAVAGTYNPIIILDPNNKIAELYETNNQDTLSVIVE